MINLSSLSNYEERKCKNVGPDVFFPEMKDSDEARVAIKICAGCAIRAACYEYAIDNGERFGIWGGVYRGSGGKHSVYDLSKEEPTISVTAPPIDVVTDIANFLQAQQEPSPDDLRQIEDLRLVPDVMPSPDDISHPHIEDAHIEDVYS